MPSSHSPSFWDLITHSGPMVFSILLILVLFSVVGWAIIAHKTWQLRRAQSQSAAFLETFWQSRRLDQVYKASETLSHSPIAQVFRAGYIELVKIRQSQEGQDAAGEDDATAMGEIDSIARALRRAAASETTHLEALVPFLATTGSTCPFIGLLGTVLGIMKAFQEIGAAGSASLATVAPGISEALIATAAGLFAAIPAVMAYNWFVARIRVLDTEMENFSADFLNIVKRHFLR